MEEIEIQKIKILFGERLKEFREKNNLSQSYLGKALGYRNPRSDISNIEHGRMLPSAEKLILLLYQFNLSLDYLLGKDEQI